MELLGAECRGSGTLSLKVALPAHHKARHRSRTSSCKVEWVWLPRRGPGGGSGRWALHREAVLAGRLKASQQHACWSRLSMGGCACSCGASFPFSLRPQQQSPGKFQHGSAENRKEQTPGKAAGNQALSVTGEPWEGARVPREEAGAVTCPCLAAQGKALGVPCALPAGCPRPEGPACTTLQVEGPLPTSCPEQAPWPLQPQAPL